MLLEVKVWTKSDLLNNVEYMYLTYIAPLISGGYVIVWIYDLVQSKESLTIKSLQKGVVHVRVLRQALRILFFLKLN